MSFRLTPLAEADIEAIVLFIAEDDPAAAVRWLDDMLRRCQRVGDMPGIGVSRHEIRPGLRTFPMGNYLILYREFADGAEIVRVIHGARQWQELL